MLNINEISKIGIGTYRMTNNSEDSGVLNYALKSGINIIDTASNYGFGESELLLGNNISKQMRSSIFIVSKVGYIQGEDINRVKNMDDLEYVELNEHFLFSIAPEFISFQLEQSLKRLKTDYIDCYLLHNPEYYYETNFSKSDLKIILLNSFSLLEQKVKEGKIRYYGISSNLLSSLPLKDILNSLHEFPNLKFLQFPYNIVERNYSFQLNDLESITIHQLKEQGLILLSNRPLNTTYGDKVLRLSDNPIENIDSVRSQEELSFNTFTSIIQQRLSDMQEDDSLENYYPISFFIENRRDIANQEAINKSINSYLIPFLEALELKNKKVLENLNDLRNYWIIFSQYNNQNRLDILKNKLYDEKILTRGDNRDLSLILAENYLNSGIDTVLMGLRKKTYIDKITDYFS
ncbi:Aldo/keto reductase family protein [Chryseobacterium sp. RU37D]|uniref:aldo/keto reductase n=1 Tax=Chryseobacterium sp. RU37D TaxID=1907397 RepID=UPI000953F379|nr:aldo/keto reductase [Chryseobacterium sp. RU37D]SIQ80652.1 Aldo/keto reductase family protein [Chryseobacterium sp. RU37D]